VWPEISIRKVDRQDSIAIADIDKLTARPAQASAEQRTADRGRAFSINLNRRQSSTINHLLTSAKISTVTGGEALQ